MAQVSKKTKDINDSKKAKFAWIINLRDQWLIRWNKITPALKAKLKKIKAIKTKEKAKQDKN